MSGRVALVSHLPYYQHAAVALHRAGLLERYLTAPVGARPLRGERVPVLGREIEAFNRRRVEPALADVPVVSMWAAQAAAVAAQRAAFALGRGTGLPVRARLWDLEIGARLGDPAVVHAVSELFGTAVVRRARAGAFTICDVRSAHPRSQVAIVAPLLARHGITYRLPEVGLRARLERAFATADLLVANSSFTAASFVDQGLPADRVVVVPLGCDPDRFAPAPVPPERFTVLFVGRERFAKGFLELAAAARALRPDDRLVISGERDPITEQALAGVRAEVEFLGPVGPESLAALYRSASVLALPSYAEGFAMVVLEAMASGLPVVVTTNVGAASLVEEAGAGFVVEPGDADALADRLRALSDDAALAARMGAAGRARAVAQTWDGYGERLVAAYHAHVPLNR